MRVGLASAGVGVKFVNSHPSSPLSFECGGTQYEVPLGGMVEIPDRFAYAVKLMGLPLVSEEEATSPATESEPAERASRKR